MVKEVAKKPVLVSVADESALVGLSLGDKVRVTYVGRIVELEGPRERPDYDEPSEIGKKRPMVKEPGRVRLQLEESPEFQVEEEGGIEDLNKMLWSEEC